MDSPNATYHDTARSPRIVMLSKASWLRRSEAASA